MRHLRPGNRDLTVPGKLRAARHPTASIRTPDSFQNPCLSFTPHDSFASVSPPLDFQSKPLCSAQMDPDSQALDQMPEQLLHRSDLGPAAREGRDKQDTRGAGNSCSGRIRGSERPSEGVASAKRCSVWTGLRTANAASVVKDEQQR